MHIQTNLGRYRFIYTLTNAIWSKQLEKTAWFMMQTTLGWKIAKEEGGGGGGGRWRGWRGRTFLLFNLPALFVWRQKVHPASKENETLVNRSWNFASHHYCRLLIQQSPGWFDILVLAYTGCSGVSWLSETNVSVYLVLLLLLSALSLVNSHFSRWTWVSRYQNVSPFWIYWS